MHEKTLKRQTIYEGRILNLELLDVELENGIRTRREVIRHPGASVVVCRADDGRYIFVKQFRKPLEQEVLEAVAGTLEPGEPPEHCARREVREETGCTARTVRHLGTVYPSPGYLEERMEIFFAEVDQAQEALATDEDEHILPVWLSRVEVDAAIRSGELFDAKTLAAWLLYEKLTAGKDSDAGRS